MRALFRFLILPLALAGFAATGASPAASALFNGELLVAPPPPNWTGGTAEPTKTGLRRLWRRIFQDGSETIERIVLTQREKGQLADAAEAAKLISDTVTSVCSKKTLSEITVSTGDSGPIASLTARCSGVIGAKPGTILYSLIKVYVGEYNVFSARRTWIGNSKDTGSPLNSPRTAESWSKYFARVAICNTLVSDCDPAKAEIVHADPRFRTMRALPVTVRPVMPQIDVRKAAGGFGELTGRAESCGEDVSPLAAKIARMFNYITANDQDSSEAQAAFKDARKVGFAAQDKQKKETCGQVLQEYRQHPSRVSTFYHYLERFL